ncbi:MAG: ribonuclease D, partial [Myxococcota bacterium]
MVEPQRSVHFLLDGQGTEADWQRLTDAPRVAVDTESDPFHRYFEKVCLIQISTESEDFIYDPLDRGLVDPLRKVLADSERIVVLHGGDYDVRALKQSF